MDASARAVAAVFHEPGLYVTEANFLVKPGAEPHSPVSQEDDGLLFTILYNSSSDTSLAALLEPQTMKLVEAFDMGGVIPYHSHGVICQTSGKCFSNP